jgi:SOS-response transcriptional repressor LexA
MRTNEEIVRILIDEKNKQNLSISELARRVDMAKSAISRYFNFSREFPLNRADDFARVLGISTEYLLGISKDEIPNKTKKQSPIVEEINKISSQLEEPRQKVVLDTANNQLDEQNQEKKKESKVIPINKIPDDLPPYISRKILENFVMPTNTMEYEPDEDMVDVPILGRIAAGLPLDAVENFDGTRPVPAHFLSSARDYYWLMVDGHSMEPKIPFGSYVLIEAVPDVTDGTIGAVLFQDDCQATLKKVYHEIDCLRLVSINKEFKDQFATQDNPAAVIGQAVKVEIDL